MLSISYLSLHRSQPHQPQTPSGPSCPPQALAYTVPSSFTSGWFLFATWAAGRPVHLLPSFPQQHLRPILTLPQGQASPPVCISLHSKGSPGACCSLDSPCVCAKSQQLCPTLYDPTGYSPPGSSVHGILQARILEWVSMPSSRGSSQLRD